MARLPSREEFRLEREYWRRSNRPREIMPRAGRPRERCVRCRRVFWFPGVAWDGRYCSAECADPVRAPVLRAAFVAVSHWQDIHLCRCRSSKGRRKIKYPTEQLAREAMAEAPDAGQIELSVYECPRGEGFHLTSRPRTQQSPAMVDRGAL